MFELDFEELDSYTQSQTTGGYKLFWVIGVRKFKNHLEQSGYTFRDLANEFEITEATLYSRLQGRTAWDGYELDFLEEYLGLCVPDGKRG